MKEFIECTNYFVIPRSSDNKLIGGSYNRVWKEEKYVGTINCCNVINIGKLGGENMDDLRIRKLTPRECWRLMGFSDECFDKAKEVNKDTQLYKQAGNSIVVDVLYHIFKNLI